MTKRPLPDEQDLAAYRMGWDAAVEAAILAARHHEETTTETWEDGAWRLIPLGYRERTRDEIVAAIKRLVRAPGQG